MKKIRAILSFLMLAAALSLPASEITLTTSEVLANWVPGGPEILRFDLQTEHCLVGPWSGVEEDRGVFRWIEGRRASLKIPPGETLWKSVILETRSLEDGNGSPQTLTLSVDGKVAGTATLSASWEQKMISIPPTKSGLLSFSFSKLYIPSKVIPGSGDNRTLAAAFRTIALVDTPPALGSSPLLKPEWDLSEERVTIPPESTLRGSVVLPPGAVLTFNSTSKLTLVSGEKKMSVDGVQSFTERDFKNATPLLLLKNPSKKDAATVSAVLEIPDVRSRGEAFVMLFSLDNVSERDLFHMENIRRLSTIFQVSRHLALSVTGGQPGSLSPGKPQSPPLPQQLLLSGFVPHRIRGSFHRLPSLLGSVDNLFQRSKGSTTLTVTLGDPGDPVFGPSDGEKSRFWLNENGPFRLSESGLLSLPAVVEKGENRYTLHREDPTGKSGELLVNSVSIETGEHGDRVTFDRGWRMENEKWSLTSRGDLLVHSGSDTAHVGKIILHGFERTHRRAEDEIRTRRLESLDLWIAATVATLEKRRVPFVLVFFFQGEDTEKVLCGVHSNIPEDDSFGLDTLLSEILPFPEGALSPSSQ